MARAQRRSRDTYGKIGVLAALWAIGCGSESENSPAEGPGPVTDGGGGSGGTSTGGTANGGNPSGGSAGEPVGAGNTWSELSSIEWTLNPAEEKNLCRRQTLTEDVFIGGFRGGAELGMHHAVIFLAENPPLAPDGLSTCPPFETERVMLFAAGVGTGDLVFPSGVATRIPAGSQILFSLHSYNPTTDPLTGTSAIQMIQLDEAEVEHEATIVLSGKVITLSVPPGESTQRGTCTLTGDVTAFAAFPHMHQLGTHLMTRILPSTGEPVPVLDMDFSFEDQRYVEFEPIALHAGDTVEVNCTYQNPGAAVGFGESSDTEMCFTGLYWYPPIEIGSFGSFCFND